MKQDPEIFFFFHYLTLTKLNPSNQNGIMMVTMVLAKRGPSLSHYSISQNVCE